MFAARHLDRFAPRWTGDQRTVVGALRGGPGHSWFENRLIKSTCGAAFAAPVSVGDSRSTNHVEACVPVVRGAAAAMLGAPPCAPPYNLAMPTPSPAQLSPASSTHTRCGVRGQGCRSHDDHDDRRSDGDPSPGCHGRKGCTTRSALYSTASRLVPRPPDDVEIVPLSWDDRRGAVSSIPSSFVRFTHEREDCRFWLLGEVVPTGRSVERDHRSMTIPIVLASCNPA